MGIIDFIHLIVGVLGSKSATSFELINGNQMLESNAESRIVPTKDLDWAYFAWSFLYEHVLLNQQRQS